MAEWSGSVAFKVDLVYSLPTGYSITCYRNNMMSARSFEYNPPLPPPISRPTASRSGRLNIYPISNFLDFTLHFIDRGV